MRVADEDFHWITLLSILPSPLHSVGQSGVEPAARLSRGYRIPPRPESWNRLQQVQQCHGAGATRRRSTRVALAPCRGQPPPVFLPPRIRIESRNSGG